VIFNAAFRALDLDWIFLAFEVAPEDGAAARVVEGMKTFGFGGLSVTMPHKTAMASAVDRLSASAEALQAVNTVYAGPAGAMVGDNTDGEGLLAALRADLGFDAAGRCCLVVGAGGAGRAVVKALADAGAREVIVVNRDARRGETAAALAASRGRVGVAEEAAAADLIVNATPLGMATAAGGSDALPVDPQRVGPGQLVVDLVYRPALTPLVVAARARGAAATGGLGMLVHQAALSFRLWTGEDPPLEAMSASALAELVATET